MPPVTIYFWTGWRVEGKGNGSTRIMKVQDSNLLLSIAIQFILHKNRCSLFWLLNMKVPLCFLKIFLIPNVNRL